MSVASVTNMRYGPGRWGFNQPTTFVSTSVWLSLHNLEYIWKQTTLQTLVEKSSKEVHIKKHLLRKKKHTMEPWVKFEWVCTLPPTESETYNLRSVRHSPSRTMLHFPPMPKILKGKLLKPFISKHHCIVFYTVCTQRQTRWRSDATREGPLG